MISPIFCNGLYAELEVRDIIPSLFSEKKLFYGRYDDVMKAKRILSSVDKSCSNSAEKSVELEILFYNLNYMVVTIHV